MTTCGPRIVHDETPKNRTANAGAARPSGGLSIDMTPAGSNAEKNSERILCEAVISAAV